MLKQLVHAFAMCQSMFCAIPCPCNIWDEKARDKMLLFLPLVGLEIGLIWACLAWLCRYLNLPALIAGFVLCAFPYFVTGFIHLDGFMDVTDAVKSCRSLERRREILKDSHVGSFSVIGCILLMLAQFSMFASAPNTAEYLILIFVPVISRCGSSLAISALKPMSTSQYAQVKESAGQITILILMVCAALMAGFLLCGRYGFVLIGGMAGYALALRRAYCCLDGMNGDISGYALTLSELVSVVVFALL